MYIFDVCQIDVIFFDVNHTPLVDVSKYSTYETTCVNFLAKFCLILQVGRTLLKKISSGDILFINYCHFIY